MTGTAFFTWYASAERIQVIVTERLFVTVVYIDLRGCPVKGSLFELGKERDDSA